MKHTKHMRQNIPTTFGLFCALVMLSSSLMLSGCDLSSVYKNRTRTNTHSFFQNVEDKPSVEPHIICIEYTHDPDEDRPLYGSSKKVALTK